MEGTEIVVGTDGSGCGTAAVRWAMREAARWAAPVRVVLAYDFEWPRGRKAGDIELRRMAETQADTMVADAVIEASRVGYGVNVRKQAVLGEPVTVLLAAACGAALLVVGHRGRGGFTSLLLGSVGQRVAAHAGCPVAVVRGRWDASDGPVVVGVDDSADSDTALELAFTVAAGRESELLAIRAYVPPTPPWGVDMPPLADDQEERHRAEHDALAATLTPWLDKFPHVHADGIVARGNPARVLVGASHTAQLVVVGSRGPGDFTESPLGSVGLQLLHHSDCPVLIARSPTRG